MAQYIHDGTIPKPLLDALIDSDKEYAAEVKEFMSDKKHYHYATSVTSLNRPTQASELARRHGFEIYVHPLKDCWHSFMGNVIHFVLEKYAAKDPDYITEFRLGAEITVDGKLCYIHGKFDLYNKVTEKIQDWKLTSGTNMMYPKTDFERQLNVLRYILLRNGWKVKGMEDVYLFPHLDKTKMNNPLYPKEHALVTQVEEMPINEVEEMIKNKIRSQLTEKDKPDKELTPCTNEERWVRDSSWNIYLRKKGGKKGEKQEFSSRAAFRAPTVKEIIRWRKENGIPKEDSLYKEFKGEPKMCAYCKSAPFCHQRLNEIIEAENQPKE